jgi:hypothetical protein
MSVRGQLKGLLWFPLGRWGTVQVEAPARALGSFEGPRIRAGLMLGRAMLMLLRFRVMTRMQLVVWLLRALRRVLLKMRWLLRLVVRRLLLRLVMLSVARVVGTALWNKILIHLGQQGRHKGLHVLHHCVIHMENAF